MKRIIFLFIFVLLLSVICPAGETKQLVPPKPPAEPAKPAVPGAAEHAPAYPKFPGLPPLPSFPHNNSQRNRPVKVIEKYELFISEASPGGDPLKNAANTISYAEYVLYSNNTISIRIDFKNNSRYIYHLRNNRSKMEIRPGVYREMYDTVIQAGEELLLESYISELCYNDNGIISINVFEKNKIVVTINVTRKSNT
ncbi:MAG: hypothetical protein LBD48_07390 [Treponema sp.]|nr:hypothetical protein [Treponema sp.]